MREKMISIHEVFLREEIKSADSITDQERMNLNAYLLDHYGLAFKDIHSDSFDFALKKAIILSKKSIDIPIHIVKTAKNDRDSFRYSVIFGEI